MVELLDWIGSHWVDILHSLGIIAGGTTGSLFLFNKGNQMKKLEKTQEVHQEVLQERISGLRALIERVESRLDRMDNRMDNVLGYEKPVSQDKDDSDESLEQEG